MYNINYSS